MIYLHIPFCESFCVYCGFFSVTPASEPHDPVHAATKSPAPSLPLRGPVRANDRRSGSLSPREECFEAFAAAVTAEIEARRDEIAAAAAVNTLYIGGGTPSVLPLDVLSRIVHSLNASREGVVPPNPPCSALRPVSPSAIHPFKWPRVATGLAGTPLHGDTAPSGDTLWDEFTVEVNPEDIVTKGEEYALGLMELGVNRISMGIQSFDDGILRWMNRRHDAAAAEEAFSILRRAGFENISVDLIFGLSQLDEKTWNDTIDKTLAFGPEHISAYQLSVEEGSALEKMIAKGKYSEAPEELCRRQYDILCARLGAVGYRHYEISNFALPGREAIHNSAYWRRVPYVGLGPGAHSLSTDSVRSWNSQEIPRRLRDGRLAAYSREEEKLTPDDIRIERIMLPLRTDLGMPEEELRSLTGDETVERLLSEGALIHCHPACHPERSEGSFLDQSEGSLRIPEDHFFTSDEIIRELI